MRLLHTLLLALFTTTMVAQGSTPQPLTLEQKVAKLLIVGMKGTTLTPNNSVVEAVKGYGVSGVIFFEHNIAPVKAGRDSKAILKKLLSDLQGLTPEPIFLAIDQEGGAVNRLKTKYGFAPMPSHKAVAQSTDSDYAQEVAATIAHEVASVGFNLNFAPCVDVDVNPSCPVIGARGRSFSADENRVSQLAITYINEHHKQGVLTSLKHFPGHGNSKVDSHLGLTDITDTWQRRELVPYQEIIAHGVGDMVMVSHLFNRDIDPNYPATLSKVTIDSLLRKELGWSGVVVSDDMQMKAIVDHYGFEEAIVTGVNAGIDLFIISSNLSNSDYNVPQRFIQTIVNAVNSGAIQEEQIDQAVKRIEQLRMAL